MKKWLIGIIFLAVIAAGFFYWKNKNNGKSDQTSYETVRVKRGNIEVKVLSTGTIEPYTRVEVGSSVSGRIDKVLVQEGDRVKEGDILAWISSEDRISLLDAARSTMESAKKSNDSAVIKEAQAAYEIADKAYKPVTLTNSISGEVIDRSCEPGQNISTASVLFVISDRLVASVEVDEADIGKIKLGQDTWITLDAFSDEKLEGKVTKIAREGSQESGVVEYEVMVEPKKIPHYWASGMTANVEFIIAKKDSVLLVPKNAVTENGDLKFVMLMSDHPIPQKVETGITDGKMIEVTSGLKEGESLLQSSTMTDTTNKTTKNDFRPPMSMMGGGPPR